MVDRATNIRVRIDIKDAMGKITQMKQGMNSLGAAGSQAGTQVQQGMNKATGAINNAGNAAVKNAVNFQTMGQGMLNLSTAGVQTYTSISNLARAENRAEAASLGLQRAQDLLARKTLAYNKMVEQGLGNSREAKLLLNEMETATNDLAVKTDKLKIEQEAVTDVYMLFFANLANVGVSSLMIYKSMMEGVTKAKVINTAATAANTVATKLNSLAKWNSSKSLIATAVANNTATAGLVKSTLATKAATVATKALNFALGPVGLVLMTISAALVAYETNFLGFKDGINKFLGIQEDFNEGTDAGTHAIEQQTIALQGQKKAYEDLTTPMKTYIKMHEDFYIAEGRYQELLAMRKQYGLGFSSGGITTQQIQGSGGTGGTTSFESYNTSVSTTNAKRGRSSNQPTPEQQQVIDSQPPSIIETTNADPFGSKAQKDAYYMLSFEEMGAVALEHASAYPVGSGTAKAYMLEYKKIRDLSNNFTKQKSKNVDPLAEMKRIWQSIATGDSEKGGTFAGMTNIPRKTQSIFDFDLDNRELVKETYGVDIGGIGNTLTTHEAIRLGAIQKSLGRFNAQPSKFVEDVKRSWDNRGIMALLDQQGSPMPYGQAVSTGYVGNTINTYYRRDSANVINNLGGRTDELLQQIRAFGGVNANGQTSATAMYQASRVYNPRTGRMESPIRASDDFYQRLRELDNQRNLGLMRLRQSASTIFSGGGLSAPVYGKYTAGYSSFISMYSQTTARVAGEFGADETAMIELEKAKNDLLKGEHGETAVRAAMFAIKSGEIADRRIDRVEELIAEQLGIDFNANSKAGYFYRRGGSKNRPISGFVSTAKPMWQQIREDIGADANISLPSIKRMEALSLAFKERGSSWTNFNTFSYDRHDKIKLGLTEQEIFDIRFDASRGDRELLNRLRYSERLQAASSGTAPI